MRDQRVFVMPLSWPWRGTPSVVSACLALAALAGAQPQFVELGAKSLGGDAAVDGAVGDVDGDGDPDVVFSTYGQTMLFLNDGRGNFQDVTATHMPIASRWSPSIALGDLDGDGDLDLALAHTNDQSRIYQNDGSGHFTDVTAASLPNIVLATRILLLRDFDADGDLDLVFGNDGQQNHLLLNDGRGVFQDVTVTHMPNRAEATFCADSADVDGDGDLDLFFGSNSYFPYYLADELYLNDGAGRFTDVPSYSLLPFATASTAAAAFGDADGDGDVDLFLSTRRLGAQLIVNDGRGNFRQSAGSMPSGLPLAAGAFGDVDADGDLDLVLGGILLENGGNGHFSAAANRIPAGSYGSVDLSDVDGDGDLDLVLGAQALRQSNRVFTNDGSGRFGPSIVPYRVLPTSSIALGDVDGDGDEDMLLGNDRGTSSPSANRLYLNDGAGKFADGTESRLEPFSEDTSGVVLVDVDGDGDLDAILANRQEPDRLLLNDGSGTFSEATSGRLTSNGEHTLGLAVGDVDGDSDPDVVFADGSYPVNPNAPRQNRLYLNDGSGTFSEVTSSRMPVDADDSHAVALADVDGDGDLDLAFANNGQSDRLYLNDGSGRFSDASSQLPPSSSSSLGLAFVDVDGDGDRDLVFANGRALAGEQNELWLNDGTGRFTDVTATQLPPDADRSFAVAAADVDGDGDQDLAFANGMPQQNRLYLNDGTGRFFDATSRIPRQVDDTRCLALHDIDGDGDPELIFGNYVNGTSPHQTYVYTDLQRQLDTPFAVAIGRTYDLDFWALYGGAPPNATAYPFLATTPAALPLGPWGILRLAPAQMVALPPVVIPQPGQGRVTTSLLVPNQPGLVGVPLLAQALFIHGADVHLSNVTVDVVR